MTKIDISAEACALACTLRENGDAWQKRVNDLIRALRAEIDKQMAELKEADGLLEVAYYAHQKLGLEGCGNHGLSHEVRMFAMHFSQPETPKTPQHVILSGDGRYWRFRNREQS